MFFHFMGWVYTGGDSAHRMQDAQGRPLWTSLVAGESLLFFLSPDAIDKARRTVCNVSY